MTIAFRLHKADFLYVIFDLTNASYVPYRKLNNVPTYVHRLSNHPPAVIKQLPAGVEKRLCLQYNLYQGALRKSTYNILQEEQQEGYLVQHSLQSVRFNQHWEGISRPA